MTRPKLASAGLALLIVASACGDSGVEPTEALANFEAVSGNAQGAPAGEALPQPLVVEATDDQGEPVAGLTVEFAVSQGGGAVTPDQATTGANGRASASFTLGPAKGGDHAVQVSAPGTEFTVTFTATAGGEPAAVEVAAGTGVTALANTAVPVRPAARITDDAGDPVPGVEVQFTVASGGGSVEGATAMSDATGVAAVGNWILGTNGVNTLTATVPGRVLEGDPVLFVATVRPATGFDIQILHQGTPSAAQLLAFAQAEVRWEQVIAGDLPDVPATLAAGTCGTGSPAVSQNVDDLLILATLVPIDGPGTILGAAGPCRIRVPGSLPAVGQMRFDTDDLELLEQNDLLQGVILHEMGHVLGFGTLWGQLGLLADASQAGGTDPHFTGPLALAAFNSAGGASYAGQKVPVEDTGGQGTADSHWRESVFETELMTGFIGPGTNPLSAVTAEALHDQGYTVNLGVTDAYTVSPSLRLDGAVAHRGFQLHDDIARGPIYAVDEHGTIVDTVRP